MYGYSSLLVKRRTLRGNTALYSKIPISVSIYRFQNLRVFKGALKPLSARGIQWGGKRPVGTRFCWQSLVYYTFRDLRATQWDCSLVKQTLWGDHSPRWRTHHPSHWFTGQQNTAISESTRLMKCWNYPTARLYSSLERKNWWNGRLLRHISKERWRFEYNDPSNWCAPKMAKCIETFILVW